MAAAPVRVSVAVQHHPSREPLLRPLVTRLPDGLDTEVVTDPWPDSPVKSPLRCYLHALRTTPEGCTHRLIVQDDAWPCDDFPRLMQAAVEEKPEDMVAFFAPGAGAHRSRIARAMQAGESWALLHALWYPTVALCWPAQHIQPFLDWTVAERIDPEKTIGDDGPVGKWCHTAHVKVWAPVPSLVEHPDVAPSLYGRNRNAARAGSNAARVAWAFRDR